MKINFKKLSDTAITPRKANYNDAGFDLYGFRKSDGKIIYIEVKNEKGRLREDQKRFLEEMEKYPVIAGVCRSVEDAIKLVTERKD